MNHEDTKGAKFNQDERSEWIATQLVDSALKVHQALGPGLLESAYRACLAHELSSRGIAVREEVPIPVIYEGIKLEIGYRADLVLDDRIIVEPKAVEKLLPIHEAQLITYLRLANLRLGFLINFHTPLLKQGLKRIVN